MDDFRHWLIRRSLIRHSLIRRSLIQHTLIQCTLIRRMLILRTLIRHSLIQRTLIRRSLTVSFPRVVPLVDSITNVGLIQLLRVMGSITCLRDKCAYQEDGSVSLQCQICPAVWSIRQQHSSTKLMYLLLRQATLSTAGLVHFRISLVQGQCSWDTSP